MDEDLNLRDYPTNSNLFYSIKDTNMEKKLSDQFMRVLYQFRKKLDSADVRLDEYDRIPCDLVFLHRLFKLEPKDQYFQWEEFSNEFCRLDQSERLEFIIFSYYRPALANFLLHSESFLSLFRAFKEVTHEINSNCYNWNTLMGNLESVIMLVNDTNTSDKWLSSASHFEKEKAELFSLTQELIQNNDLISEWASLCLGIFANKQICRQIKDLDGYAEMTKCQWKNLTSLVKVMRNYSIFQDVMANISENVIGIQLTQESNFEVYIDHLNPANELFLMHLLDSLYQTTTSQYQFHTQIRPFPVPRRKVLSKFTNLLSAKNFLWIFLPELALEKLLVNLVDHYPEISLVSDHLLRKDLNSSALVLASFWINSLIYLVCFAYIMPITLSRNELNWLYPLNSNFWFGSNRSPTKKAGHNDVQEEEESIDEKLIESTAQVHVRSSQHRLSFTLYANSISVLLGHEGKSFLLRSIKGIQKPHRGQVIVKSSSSIGFYSDSINEMNPYLTVQENINFLARVQGMKKMKEPPLIGRLNKLLFNELNLRQKKQVSIVSTLFVQNKVILLDEPFKDLPIEDKFQLAQVIAKYKQGTSFLIATDCPQDVNLLDVDQLGILSKEKLEYFGEASEFEKTFKTSTKIKFIIDPQAGEEKRDFFLAALLSEYSDLKTLKTTESQVVLETTLKGSDFLIILVNLDSINLTEFGFQPTYKVEFPSLVTAFDRFYQHEGQPVTLAKSEKSESETASYIPIDPESILEANPKSRPMCCNNFCSACRAFVKELFLTTCSAITLLKLLLPTILFLFYILMDTYQEAFLFEPLILVANLEQVKELHHLPREGETIFSFDEKKWSKIQHISSAWLGSGKKQEEPSFGNCSLTRYGENLVINSNELQDYLIKTAIEKNGKRIHGLQVITAENEIVFSDEQMLDSVSKFVHLPETDFRKLFLHYFSRKQPELFYRIHWDSSKKLAGLASQNALHNFHLSLLFGDREIQPLKMTVHQQRKPEMPRRTEEILNIFGLFCIFSAMLTNRFMRRTRRAWTKVQSMPREQVNRDELPPLLTVSNMVFEKDGKVYGKEEIKCHNSELLLVVTGDEQEMGTELLESIVGMRTQLQGTISFFGQNPHGLCGAMNRLTSVCPKNVDKYRDFTTAQVVSLFEGLQGGCNQVETVISRFDVDLNEWACKKLRHLPRDVERKLWISISLINDPEIVCMDQTLDSMDYKSKQQFYALCQEMIYQKRTLILTSRNVEHCLAEENFVKILFLKNFKTIERCEMHQKDNFVWHILICWESEEVLQHNTKRFESFFEPEKVTKNWINEAKTLYVLRASGVQLQKIYKTILDFGTSIYKFDVRQLVNE
ncbi:ABC transporter [Cichlidogyrus casuarinus]|uniref:ABC transporter n=1 Tax=Cichlidogyrus casuarinus TaxID=1844966 RepID=A0ABD2QIJ5_9PLAT